jgi:hypothetical protein
MDPSNLPKQQSKELNGDGRPINLPGVYEHKDTDAVFITSEGDEGVAQADALMSPLWKDAWERVSDVPSRTEILEMRKAQEVKDATADALAKGKEEAEMRAAKKAALEAEKAASDAEAKQ